jgi:hypothetical protein
MTEKKKQALITIAYHEAARLAFVDYLETTRDELITRIVTCSQNDGLLRTQGALRVIDEVLAQLRSLK